MAEQLLGHARNCRLARQAMIPMRDGVRLAATIFLPEAEGRYPVVLQRRPYNRLEGLDGWEDWVTNGYGFICQDTRGRFDSEGEFNPMLQEINDTPDTIGWLRQQPWCNGQVGMMGPSYLGLVQTAGVAGGADLSKVWREWLAHPTDGDYWAQYGVAGRHDRFTMPTLQVCGWYDYYPSETIYNWQQMVAKAKTPEIAANHKLLLGPWGHHHGLEPTPDGQRAVDFGPDNIFDCHSIYRQWYDRVFKGIRPADGLGDRPIRLFVMGRNQWRDEDEWPLARTRFTNFYLHAGGNLSPAQPHNEPPDRYDYDPANPVPTRGGNHSIGPWNEFYKDYIWCGPCDQRPNEARPDVLVYTTTPLEHDLEVTGPVTVKLWAASSARDTDFVARLIDVYPDSQAINITEGVVRAGNWTRPELIEPGAVLEYTIELEATSNVFLAGHCIRLHITSSNFPLWDRNLNTGENPNTSTAMVVAHQEIRHDARYPSHLVLPVIPEINL